METSKLYFEKKNVWLAEMKYYSKEDNGIEVSDPLTYAFIVDLGEGQFANPFDISEDFPVFQKLPYSNCTSTGVEYGSKVFLANTIDRTGPCYVLSKNVGDMGLMGDIVSSEQLIDYMFKNSEELYFKDRKGYAKDKLIRHPFTLRKLMESDEEKEARMTAFLAERSAHLRLIK